MKTAVRSTIVSLLLLTLVGVTYGQSSGEKRNNARAPNYRIGLKFRTVESKALPGPPMLVLQISIKPSAFTRDSMIALAQRLKSDFAKEERLQVAFFSDYDAAKSFGGRTNEEWAWVRGDYHLDRTTGEEQLNFIPDPKDPQRNIKIDLTRPN